MKFKAIFALGVAALVVLATAGSALAFGQLSQQPGKAGCISSARAEHGSCRQGRALTQANQVVVSPDGRNAYSVGYGAGSLSIFDRNPQTGALHQKPGKAGCIADEGQDGCQAGRALDDARGVAVSGDGATVYVAGQDSNAVAVFDRNPQTGALHQKQGKAGCISRLAKESSCAHGSGLGFAAAVTVSPDGRSVYVSSISHGSTNNGEVAVFARDPATGTLSQPAGVTACLSPDGSGGCLADAALFSPLQVTVSPDSRYLYVDNFKSNTIAVLARDTSSGNLTAQQSAFACRTGGTTGCEAESATFGATGQLVISGDGKNAYLSSLDGQIGVFDRDPASGTLTQKTGSAGCFSGGPFTMVPAGACQSAKGWGEPEGIAISPDGMSVYISSYTVARMMIFARDTASGTLSQEAGAGGCISLDGSRGACGRGKAFGGSSSVTVSPDGKSVYVASAAASGLAIFNRDTGG